MNCLRASQVRGIRRDRGFTLVEVMVAMVVFLLVSAAALTMIVGALTTIRGNSDRVAAASIARSQAESLRAAGAYAIPIGQHTSTVVNTQGTYSVATTANWIGVGQTTDPCHVGTGVVPGQSYVRVHVAVTSEKLGAPQTIDTLVYPLDPVPAVNNTGTATVAVANAQGLPVSGVSVSGTDLTGAASGLSYTTGADGCVFIPNVPVGTQWNFQVSKPGYIAETLGGDQIIRQIQALANTPFSFNYDLPSTIKLNVLNDGFDVPANVTISVSPDPLGRAPALVQNFPVSVTGLWPRSAGYSAWLGRCSDAATTAATLVSVQAGAISEGTLNGAKIEIVAPQNAVITAVHSDAQGGSGGCAETFTLGTVSSSLLLRSKIPFGIWSLSSSLSASKIAISVTPSTGKCSVQWDIPGAVSASAATQTPAPSPSPSNSPLLVYPVVSAPCPAPA